MNKPNALHKFLFLFICYSIVFCIFPFASANTILETDVETEKKVLRFIQPSYCYLLNELFLELHPDVSIEYLDWDPNDTSLYIPYLNPVEEFNINDPLSPIVDIYVLNAADGLSRLIQDEYLQDLSGSTKIVNTYESYIPQVKELLSVNGKPVAIPVSFTIATWNYNELLWNALDLPDVPKTVEGIVKFIQQWNNDPHIPLETILYGNGELYDTRLYMLIDFIRIYVMQSEIINEPINFDTPAFRNVVNLIINLPMLQKNSSTSSALLHCQDILYPKMATLMDIDDMLLYDRVNMPLFPMGISDKHIPKVSAELGVICISKNTHNLELAIEYLEFILEHQSLLQKDLHAMLTLDLFEMDRIGIQSKTQTIYYQLASDIKIYLGTFGKFLTMNDDGDYYFNLLFSSYNISDLEYSSDELSAILLSSMRTDLEPLVNRLNLQSHAIFNTIFLE